MATKIGRNDPCPCGSGKKYKQCCGGIRQVTPGEDEKPHDGAVGRAIDWLMSRHRKAAVAALNSFFTDDLSDDEHAALSQLDHDTLQAMELNGMEWLLAEGDILIRGEKKLVSEILAGPGGPLMSVEQRRWIAQLAARPLRLYIITDVLPGRQTTLCDAIKIKEVPVTVIEKSGSQTLKVGTYLGCRVMRVDERYELSGAVYPFSKLAASDILTALKAGDRKFKKQQDEHARYISRTIRQKWTDQYLKPTPWPTVMDAHSGEPILLITDHYRVEDWLALSHSLSAQQDVEGDRKTGWLRFIDCNDDERRTIAAINIETKSDRISIFYKTQTYAVNGKSWFEKIAENAVTFVTREISDLKGMMSRRDKNCAMSPPSPTPVSEFSPEVAEQIIEQTLHRMYKNWAVEAIPALGGKTPLQAMKTPTGLERVKGLIRSYEAAETAQAAEQNRRRVSFDFLWQPIGILR
jgi:hypothetical protein